MSTNQPQRGSNGGSDDRRETSSDARREPHREEGVRREVQDEEQSGRDHRGSYADGLRDGRSEGQREGRRVATDRDDRDRDGIEQERRSKFGGFNWGADFFGWLVAIGVTALVASIVGAIAAAVESSLSVTQDEAERSAGSIGIGTGIALLVVLMIGYFAGGYVAGRMSRYDGGRQGIGVWLIGLVITIVVAIVGAVAGSQYNILDRIDLPSLPVPTDAATVGGLIALAAVVVGTLLAAFLGGTTGQRYHRKVDRYHQG